MKQRVLTFSRKIRAHILHLDRVVVHAFAWISILRITEKAAGLIISIFLFRFLTKEEVAGYGYIQTIVAICAIFGIQEFQNTVLQSVSRGFYGTYVKSNPVSFLCSTIGTAILSVFAYWYFLTQNYQMAFGFLVAAIIFPFLYGLRQWRGLYQGEKRFGDFARAEASNAIIKGVLIVASLYYFPHEIVIPIIIFLSVPALQNIIRTVMSLKKIPPFPKYEEGSLLYGFRTNFYSAVYTLATQIDKVVLFAVLPPAALAIYMGAEKFSDVLQGVVQDISAILAPKFATIETYTEELDAKLKILAAVIGGGILIFAFVALPYLLPFVLGQGYKDSVFLAQILICGGAIRNIASLRFRFIRSKIDEKSYRQVTVYSAIAHITASLTLIPLFGLYGAVASVFIQRLILSLIVDRIIRTRYLTHGT